MEKVYVKREGVFEADMKDIAAKSQISETFDGATVFLTGATGFLGKLFLEKLLRGSPKIKMVYILVRPKKGKDPAKRVEEIFDCPSMVPMKLLNPKFLDKVTLINGDCTLPDLGMDEESKKKLVEEINFVIHCAATVRFDEHIKRATHINVRSLRDLVELSKQMKQFKGFLHVSTAFSHCPRATIEEDFYEPGMDPDKLLDLVEAIDEERLTNITPGLLGKWPNTYVFTKAVAEEIVKKEMSNLPIVIIRPSIVLASVNEPVKGWIDNFYGPTGVFVGAALGLIRTVHGKASNKTEMIPVDYVINAGLAVLWDLVQRIAKESSKISKDDQKQNQPLVYNVVSSPESPITWGRFVKLGKKHGVEVPTELQVWNDMFKIRENYYSHILAIFFLHIIPAYLVDFICLCIGKEQMLVKGYKKIHKFLDVLSYFSMGEWKFDNSNLQELWQRLPPEDQKRYYFSMKNFDWEEYFHFYVRGGRVYLLKDPLETIPKGKVKYWKLFFAHYALIAFLLFLFVKLLCILFRCIF